MDSDKSVTANFIEEKITSYTLTVSENPAGAGNVKIDPDKASYSSREKVNLTASANDRYIFTGWSGDASGTTNPIAVIMDSYKSIAANFEKTSVYPPLNFRGKKILNRSFSQAEYINVLTWEANPKNKNIIKYRIYQIKGENNVLLVELDSDTFEYWRRRVVKNKQYVYSIVAVNDENRESDPAIVDIK